MNRIVICLIFVMNALPDPATASAAVMVHEEGTWPKDWPTELEPLRKSSRTIDVATGIQQKIYEIRVPDAETFQKIWPAVLKLRTPGSPLMLDRTQAGAVNGFLHNKAGTIRVYAPTGSHRTAKPFDILNPPDIEELIREGRALRVAAPWPKEIVGTNGELPEYVVSELRDGRMRWVAGDPHDKANRPRGFYYRARIDIGLVVDGKIIDLNQVRLPDGVRVFDRRFDDEQRNQK